MSKAYKSVPRKSTIESISDAFSELEALGEEMRETADNMESANMGHMEKCERASEAADILEGLTEPDIPEVLADLAIEYVEEVPTRKGRGASRSVRCANACAVFSAAAAAAEARKELLDEDDDENLSAIDEFITACEDLVSEAEGVEFPGMYG